MGNVTGIQWTDHTFNPWIGCERVSAECDACYADRGARRLAAQHGLKLWDEGSTRYFTGDEYWKKPFVWNRKANEDGVRRRVFCASYGDVFENRDELVLVRDRLRGVIEETPHLDWLLLTKRPENICLIARWRDQIPPNVWLGTTVGVRSSSKRLADLRQYPARVHFVSCEPLLEDIGDIDFGGIDWVIIGGESGPKARPCATEWIERVVRQARRVGAAPFVKQLGTYVVSEGRCTDDGQWAWRAGLKDSHGGDPGEWPEHLRIREYPASDLEIGARGEVSLWTR